MMKYRTKNIIIITILSLVLLLSFLSSTPATLRNDPISIGGDVYDGGGGGPLTSSSPYLVTCDIRVPSDYTLTIQSGAQLFFEYGFDITAYGELNAEGTSTSPICLISSADNYGIVLYDGELRMQNGGSIKLAISKQKYPIDGTFMYPNKIDDIGNFFEELGNIGMDTVIMMRTKSQHGECGSNDYRWLSGFPEKFTEIFDEADSKGIDVYIGLILTGSACDDWYVNPNKDLTIQETRVTANYIEDQYGDRVSFKGWYLPDEPSLAAWSNPSMFYPYYAGLVSAIRESSNKPILIAPYFGGVYGNGYSPQTVGQRAADFKQATGIDIFVWQDSAGAYAIDLGWNNRPYTLEEFYAAISNAIGRDSLWSDNELFNWCVDPNFPGGRYHSTSVVRLYNQLKMTKYTHVEKRIVFCYEAYMNTYWNHPEGLRLLAAYKAFYGLDGDYITPLSYTWTTTPAGDYPDSGNEMFNKMTGDPKWYLDEDWTGILGDAEVIIDLGKTKHVDWIAAHLLNKNNLAIRFPDQLKIYSSDNGQNWNHRGTWDLEVDKYDSTFVFSNTVPLNVDCRYVKVRLENSVWTFISEIELVSDTVQ